MRKSVHPWLAVVGIIPMALALTGCFGGPSLPGAPGGGGGDPVDDELVEDLVEGSGDGIDFESGELPADFPVDDVPLIPGEIASGMSLAESGAWVVVVIADDKATADSAPTLLEQAGYTNDSVFAWENEQYLVIVVATQETEDGRFAVQYQVQVQA